MRLRKKCSLRLEQLEDRCLLSAAFVLDWNDLVVDVQRLRGQGNQAAARALAMMGAAVYDAVNAINPTHTVYHTDAREFPDVSSASADAAAAQAAHDVAYALYTQPAERLRFDALLTTQLGEVADGPAETAGIHLGQFVAGDVLAWRANDHSGDTVLYTPGTGPGIWQPTPRPNPTPPPAELPGLAASSPQWPLVTPFAMKSGDQFRPGPPPALTDADYTEAYREVKSLGSINSTTRTPEQTEIALYWANAGVGLWNQITHTVAAAHHLTLAENARLFAQVNVANADAFIASYDTKYAYNYWRPVTAIRAADTDGNPDTVPDSTWTPLITTPNHPSFASNHSTQSRAAAEALAAFFGTDHIGFAATSVGIERSYQTFTEAAKEGGRSRVYAGIHWSFDSAIGEAVGRKIGHYVADHYFQPLTGSGSGPLTALVPGRGRVARSLVESGAFFPQGAVTQAPLGGQTQIAADRLLAQAPGKDSDLTTTSADGAEDRIDPLSGQTRDIGHRPWFSEDPLSDALDVHVELS